MSVLHVVKKTVPGERERSLALDLLKIVACVLVVVIHVTASGVTGYLPGSLLQRLTVGFNSFSQFAVPAFIFASGFGLAARFRSDDHVAGLLRFWGRRLETVVLPYLIWSLIYLILQQRFMGICYGASGMLKLVLTGGAFYHLYFMVILIQLYLVFPLLLVFRRRFSKLGVDLVVVTVLYLVYVLWLKRYVPLSDRFFMSYLPFFYAGMVVFERPPKATLLTAFGIVGAVAFADYLVSRLAGFGAITPISMISLPLAWELYALSIVILLLSWFKLINIDEKQSDWVRRLSGVTFDVYLAHPLILFFVSRWLRASGIQSISLEMLLGLTFGLALPALARLGYNKAEDGFKERQREKKEEKKSKDMNRDKDKEE